MKTSKAVGYYQGKFKYLEGDKWPVEQPTIIILRAAINDIQ
jgi:hypothetical protein